MRFFPWALVLAMAVLPGCGSNAERVPSPTETAESVLQAHNEELLSIPGVIGTGVTDFEERTVILVIVENRDESDLVLIPPQLGGYAIVILDAGLIRELTGFKPPR